MALFISSTCATADNILRSVAELTARGFDRIELTGGTRHAHGLTPALQRLAREGAVQFTIHNYFPPPEVDFVLDLAAEDENVRRQSLDLVGRAYALAAALGLDLYSIHPGYTVALRPEKDGAYFARGEGGEGGGERHMQNLRDSLGHIVERIMPAGMRLAVENLFPLGPELKGSLLCDPEELTHFLDLYRQDERVGLLLDLGHFNVAGNLCGFDPAHWSSLLLARYPEKIFAVHSSHNAGNIDQHLPTPLDSWQVEVMREHRGLISRLPVTMEWHGALGQADVLERFQAISRALGF